MAFSGRQFFKNSDRGDWQSATDALETGFTFGFFGAFSDSTTQTITANTATPMTFNTTEESFGVSIGSPSSRIVIANPGTYNIQFSAQLDKTDPGADDATVWLRIDGSDVPRSATDLTLRGNNERVVAACEQLVDLGLKRLLVILNPRALVCDIGIELLEGEWINYKHGWCRRHQ